MSLKQRLERINQRIATKVDRRLGYLSIRLYFKRSGESDYSEVPVISMSSGGKSQNSFGGTLSTETPDYTVTISGVWYDANRGAVGVWAIRRHEGDPLLPVEVVNIVDTDEQEDVTYSFKVTQQVQTITF